MRTFARLLLCASLAAFLPACSILFDGSGFRSGGGTDAGRDAPMSMIDTGPPTSCGDPSECDIGEWCDLAVTATCLPGCDEHIDCGSGSCDFDSHECIVLDCTRDMDCPDGTYCDPELSECWPCDEDIDGYADDEAPLYCVRPVTGLLPGDCDDDDFDTHPFALPDCDESTNETCGTGNGRLVSTVFEVGLLGRGALPDPVSPESLAIYTTASSADGATVVITADRTGPVFTSGVISGGTSLTGMMGMPGFPLTDGTHTMLSSSLSGTRVLDASSGAPTGEVFISSLDLIDEGLATALSQYAMVVNSAGGALPLFGTDYRRPVVANGPYAVRGAVVANEIGGGVVGNAFLGGISEDVDGAWIHLLGVNGFHMERVAYPSGGGIPAVTEMVRGYSGNSGGAFATSFRSGLLFWNGGVGGRELFASIDSASSSRSAVMSGADGGDVVGLTVAPTGGGMITGQEIRCTSGAGSGCTIGSSTRLLADVELGSGAGDPLLTGDHVGGPFFIVAGRGSQGGIPGLVVTGWDLSGTVPLGDPVFIPLPMIGGATDIDVSVMSTGMPGVGFQLTAAYAVSTAGEVHYGALRLCSR